MKLTFDQGAPVTVPLDASSSTAAGQTIPIPPRTATRVEVEIAGINRPFPKSLNPIGFTEIGFGDTRVTETVRLPVTLAKDLGRAADGHRLDVVLSRLRNDPSRRLDEELTLDRRFVLPDARSFLLSGTARIEPSAPDSVIDSAMGTTAPGTQYTSSSHLMGDADARASRAFDHDPKTVWTEEVGNPGPAWLDVSMPTAHTVDQLRLTMAADHKHSIPSQITIFADGQPARTLPVPHVSRGTRDGTERTVEMHFDPVTGKDLHIQIDAYRPQLVPTGPESGPALMPVSIIAADMPGIPVPAAPATIDSGCRSDLVTVDGAPFPVSVVGPSGDARSGLDLEPCASSVALGAGSHTVQTASGAGTGFAVDRVVLSSDRAGKPAPVTPAGAPISDSGARVRITDSNADSYHLRVRTDGTPFWLVLGESHNEGWEATVDGHSLGSPVLVNGFANGWTVRPGHRGDDRRRAPLDAAAHGVDRPRGVGARGARVPGARVRAPALGRDGAGPGAARSTGGDIAVPLRARDIVTRRHGRCGGHCRGSHRARVALVDRRPRGRGGVGGTAAHPRSPAVRRRRTGRAGAGCARRSPGIRLARARPAHRRSRDRLVAPAPSGPAEQPRLTHQPGPRAGARGGALGCSDRCARQVSGDAGAAQRPGHRAVPVVDSRRQRW